MKTLILFLPLIFLLSPNSHAQKYITRNGHVWFFSEAPLENIEAHNYQVSSILDIGSGNIVFIVPMKGFEFEKALMQEHFNEKYVHSDKYPKSKFKGAITNIDNLALQENGEYKANVKGDLTIHGVTKTKMTDGTLTVKGDTITGKSMFRVAVNEFNIKIPTVVEDNIADTVDVHVNLTFKKHK